jgi:small subunit ribosomal protein S7
VPRKGPVPRREIQPDPVYQSELVARLTNKVMKSGDKSLAQRIVYTAFQRVEEKTGRKPLDVLEAAMKNVMPVLEVKPRRVGGSTYQVPVEVRPERRVSLALKWLVTFARARAERTMVERLANELMDAANGTGGAVKRRDEVHRMAEANKPFAHYRW